MTYAAQYDAADGETTLFKQVTVAVNVAAKAILAEPDTTEHHAVRLKWAENLRESFAKTKLVAHQAMPSVLDDPTIAAAPLAASDSAVQAVVDALVNRLAGVITR